MGVSLALTSSVTLADILPTPESFEHLGTKTAYTLDPSEVEMNIVVITVNSKTDNSKTDNLTTIAELEYGLTKNIMIELELPYVSMEQQGMVKQSGLANVEIELKYQYASSQQSAYAFGFGIELPNDSDVGSDLWAAEITWIASFQYDGFATHTELGFEWEETEGIEEFFANLTVAFYPEIDDISYQLAAKLAVEEGETNVALVPGLKWELEPSFMDEFSIAIGLPLGLVGDVADWGIIINFEIEF